MILNLKFHISRNILRVVAFSLWIIIAASLISANAAGLAPGNWFTESGQTVTVLDTGWSFQFVGSDTSTRYVKTGRSNASATVVLPHIFPSDKPGGQSLKGYGWYFRDIAVSGSSTDKHFTLAFAGVCLRADVFVNGILAGGCTFAYLPFCVDLSPFVQKDKVLHIAVRVDSRLLPWQIPDPAAKGWWIYGGIGREVSLVVRPQHRIDAMQIRTFYRTKDTFDLHCLLTPSDGTHWDSISVAVAPQGGGHPVADFSFTGNSTVVHIGAVHPWTPEDPFRYELRFTPYFSGKKGAVISVLRGFCQLTTNGPKLLLNGKPYYLRGLARHDLLHLDGTPLTREQRRVDLVDIKSMGANFLRIAHFPQHHDIYELCDSIGLLVMDEIPAWKTDPKFLGSKSGREYGAAYIREVIAVHGNYTSIAMWSIGNQFLSFKTSVADFVSAVASGIKQVDSSRLVTFCSYCYIWDKAFESVDIIAINEYFGWELASLDMLTPMLDKIHSEWPNKPVIVSELGAQAQLGLRNAGAKLAGPIKSMIEKDISEDHQALFIGSHMDSIRSRSFYVDGMVVWAYNDYMANMNKKRAPGTPQGFNSCGVVTANRERKLSYEVIRKRYTAWRDIADGKSQDIINGK